MKKLFLQAALLSAVFTLNAKLPNIVLIMTDQQGAGAMSNSGNPDLSTPSIDRLAANGVTFSNAYCAMPLSGPSRTAMFTGIMPSQIDMLENGKPLPDSLSTRTLGHLMQRAGYNTAYAGKWHLNTNSLPADTAFGFTRLHTNDDEGLSEAVVNYLRGYDREQPFFIVTSYNNPHNICQYARRQKLPDANDIQEPQNVASCPNLPVNHLDQPFDPDVLQWERSLNYRLYPTANYTADDWRRYRNAYYRLVEHVDTEIGKITSEIENGPFADNTIVIFTSDHGDGQGAHRWNQKTALWEEIVNIPLIVCIPGNRNNAGATTEALVNNGIDLMPTLLDFAHASLPSGLKGHSFRRAAENPGDEASQPFVVTETQFVETGQTRGWMVRTPQYKYVLYEAGKNREALYDMTTDKTEMRNLAVEDKYQPVVQQHRDILQRWFIENPGTLHYSPVRFIPSM